MAKPKRIEGDYDWGAVLRLLQNSFAFMEGRIDPPSSLHGMTPNDISQFASQHILLVIEEAARPVACLFLTPKPKHLYLGKLAVDQAFRRQGLARQLIDEAEKIAQRQNIGALQLQTRVELVENHASFSRLGFVKTAEGRHRGFDRITEITMRKEISK